MRRIFSKIQNIGSASGALVLDVINQDNSTEYLSKIETNLDRRRGIIDIHEEHLTKALEIWRFKGAEKYDA